MKPENCVFCRISAGEGPISRVYEDDLTIAFMTLEQPTGYQVIVVPKAHVETVFDLTAEQATAIMQTTVTVARAVRAASKCDGLNLYQANGAAAGQDVFHFHMHIVPRYAGDAIQFDWDTTPAPRAVLDRLAGEIRAQLV